MPFALESAHADDFEDLLALRLRAMHASLTHLGRYDEQRARERLAQGFDPGHTLHIVVQGQRVGFIVLKRLSHALRLDHLYIDPAAQRRGTGSQVLGWACRQADDQLLPLELVALRGSDANRFYQRHGFALTADGTWDHDYIRMPTTPSLRAVRRLWAGIQQRDWAAARAVLHDKLQVVWRGTGERFDGADAYIELNRRFPEGWKLHLLELAHLQDGRVLSMVRIDQGDGTFFATSLCRLEGGLISAMDETFAMAETPPAWRQSLPGRSCMDPRDDARARAP